MWSDKWLDIAATELIILASIPALFCLAVGILIGHLI
jgi:hypothetical protein